MSLDDKLSSKESRKDVQIASSSCPMSNDGDSTISVKDMFQSSEERKQNDITERDDKSLESGEPSNHLLTTKNSDSTNNDKKQDSEDGELLSKEKAVPEDLFSEEECKLCDVKFINPDMADQHYNGKKHGQKENQYIRKQYEEQGIDITRFMIKPAANRLKRKWADELTPISEPADGAPSIDLAHRFGDSVEDKNPADLDKYHFSCFLCGLHFEEYKYVELHVKTAMHALRIWEYQQSSSEDHRYYGQARKRNLTEDWPEDFICLVCDKQLNSPLQWEQHVMSKNHQKKEKALMEASEEGSNPLQSKRDWSVNDEEKDWLSSGGGGGGRGNTHQPLRGLPKPQTWWRGGGSSDGWATNRGKVGGREGGLLGRGGGSGPRQQTRDNIGNRRQFGDGLGSNGPSTFLGDFYREYGRGNTEVQHDRFGYSSPSPSNAPGSGPRSNSAIYGNSNFATHNQYW